MNPQGVRWDRIFVVGIIALVLYYSLHGGVIAQPAPFKTDKLSALIVWDADPAAIATLSSGQRDVIEGTAEGTVKDYIAKHGGYEVQVVDKGNTGVDFAYPWMKEARAVEMKSYPWMVVATPKSGASFPLDKDTTTAAVLTKLKPIVEGK